MRGIPQYNFPAFEEAANQLASEGFDVRSPAQKDLDAGFNPFESLESQGNPTIKDFMREDLPMLLECDILVLLRGWENSQGAKIERNVALAVGMPVFFLDGATQDIPIENLAQDAPWVLNE